MSKNLATTLKKYQKLSDNSYKILLAYYADPLTQVDLTEDDFASQVNKMFENKAHYVENSLTEYTALPGNTSYKTCIIRSQAQRMVVSASNMNQIIANNNFRVVANNVFVDDKTNSIWTKVISDSGVTQLVQTCNDDMDELLHGALNITQAVAFSQKLLPLDSKQFDFVMFYNAASEKVESGFEVAETSQGNKVICSRQLMDTVEVSPLCIVAAATASDVVNTFKQELSGPFKDSIDAMKSYINCFFKAIEGDALADQIEKQIKTEVIKSTAGFSEKSLAGQIAKDSKLAVQASADKSKDKNLSLKEVEMVVSTKFNPSKNMKSFAFVEQIKGQENAFAIKLQKPAVSVDEISYCLSKVKETFKVQAEVNTSKDFASIIIQL